MDVDRIRDYLLEQSKAIPPKEVDRELKVADTESRVVVVIGPRRAGKTYFFYELIKKDTNSLYLNFEDTRLLDIKFNEIRDIIRLSVEITGKTPKRLFFDEIQNIGHWESAVRELLDTRKYKIYITGSSSKLLGKEIATQLRGRALKYILLPFSFREMLAAKNIRDISDLTLDEQAKMKNTLRNYLEWGGFPEVVLERSERERTLREYSEMILFKDVVERYGMKNIALARFILASIFQNFTKEMSVNSIAKSAGAIAPSRVTVYDYFDKMQDSAAFFFVNKFSRKAHLREGWPKKAYVCDNGLTKVVRFSEDIGKLMENAVFLELLRSTNKNPLMEIYFWKDASGEVDFVVKEGTAVKGLIQVTYASTKDEVENREIKGLIAASKTTRCKNLMVLTWDYKGRRKIDGKMIIFEPLWNWLLQPWEMKNDR